MGLQSSPPLLTELKGRFQLIRGLWVVSMLALATGFYSYVGTLAGALLSCVTLVLAIALLRCSNCGKSLFWQAMSKHPVGQWLNWLLDVRECPACGHTAAASKSIDRSP
jgi:endogenous inhibitor of DNA gyrase (YacG/DUF329 family)